MAWTTPQTWTAGQLVDATDMNTDVRDNSNYLKDAVDAVASVVITANDILTSNQASFSFTSIPATYAHLQLELLLRTDNASTNDTVTVVFNSDTGANYTYAFGHVSQASSAGGGITASANAITLTVAASGSTSTAGYLTPSILTIYNYADTSVYKHVLSPAAELRSSTGSILGINGGLWLSNSAITSVTLSPGSGSNFTIGSSAILKGIGLA